MKLVDGEGVELTLDSYAPSTKRGDTKDYAFVLLLNPNNSKFHAFGLTRGAAYELAHQLLEELKR